MSTTHNSNNTQSTKMIHLAVMSLGLMALVMAIFAFPVNTTAQSGIEDQIDISQAAWEALDIDTYILSFRYVSVWNIYDVQVRVEDGYTEDVRMRCQPGLIIQDRCNVPTKSLTEFTVSMLFDAARQSVESGNGRWAVVSFDETYHIPDNVAFNDPEIYDEEWGIAVIDFDVIDADSPTPIPDWQQLDLMDTDQSLIDDAIEPDIERDNLLQWIENTQTEWEAQGIKNYQIAASWYSLWLGANYTLTVTDGVVTEIVATCEYAMLMEPTCMLPELQPYELTANGLFESMRTIAELEEDHYVPFAVDSEYGFPVLVSYDEMMMADEEWVITIQHFAPTPVEEE